MNILKDKRGEGYIDTVIIVFVVVLMLAFATRVLPVFIAKSKLDTFADEAVRCAEIEGYIGNETKNRINELKANTGLDPNINWSTTGKIQLNHRFSLVLTLETDIGFFSFGSFPITLTSKATGRSEVYWKD
ncbi:protein of unknown function [Maledivibacter halophilus]|uniref:DUF4320 family protein n=2 Tax=Maledivibacter halophilus TaxID=36842 RepID=A0A1T5LNY3_9FIRM|nr:protein of unknown function [Maledivibacter halophilus]